MTVKNIKTELYKLIDDIEDKELLYLLKEEIQSYSVNPPGDMLDRLTEVQLQQIHLSVEEADKNEVISLKGYKKLTARWRTR